MSQQLNVAVIGAGIGAQHIAAYQQCPEKFNVMLLCDLDTERLHKVARHYQIQQTTTNYSDVLAEPVIDVIDVCTPPHSHFDIACQALAAGKHIICEKPLFSSVAEADRMAELLQNSSQQLMPIFQYRFGNGLQKLKYLIDQDLTGPAYLTTVETHWTRYADYFNVTWRSTWEGALGGCLLAHAIHAHDSLNYTLGPCEAVQAFTATRVNPTVEVEDCAAVTVRMRDGSLAALSVTLGACEEISRLRFCFQNLTALSHLEPYNPGTEPWTFTGRDVDWQQRIDAALRHYQPQKEGFVRQFELFHEALTQGKPLPVTLADGRRSLELVTAMYEAAETGCCVYFPIQNTHRKYHSWLPA